ncbi:MAG: hypothetical protein Q9N62_07820 [Ghiorsea sp.]|nr:hypothetical protein [Ghiorsea sp.]
MSDDRVLVYSSEDGMINKSSQPSAKAGKRNKKKKGATPSPIKNPNKQGVRIMRESKGRGGKSVSIITGLNLDKETLKSWGKHSKPNWVRVAQLKRATSKSKVTIEKSC